LPLHFGVALLVLVLVVLVVLKLIVELKMPVAETVPVGNEEVAFTELVIG